MKKKTQKLIVHKIVISFRRCTIWWYGVRWAKQTQTFDWEPRENYIFHEFERRVSIVREMSLQARKMMLKQFFFVQHIFIAQHTFAHTKELPYVLIVPQRTKKKRELSRDESAVPPTACKRAVREWKSHSEEDEKFYLKFFLLRHDTAHGRILLTGTLFRLYTLRHFLVGFFSGVIVSASLLIPPNDVELSSGFANRVWRAWNKKKCWLEIELWW